jgi:hypothetical protein
MTLILTKARAGFKSASAESASAGIVEDLMTAQRSLRKSIHSFESICGENRSNNTVGKFG